MQEKKILPLLILYGQTQDQTQVTHRYQAVQRATAELHCVPIGHMYNLCVVREHFVSAEHTSTNCHVASS